MRAHTIQVCEFCGKGQHGKRRTRCPKCGLMLCWVCAGKSRPPRCARCKAVKP